MFTIECINEIAKAGLDQFKPENKVVKENGDVLLVRSASLHEKKFPTNLLAIARAGVGVNNIPLDRCAEAGIVVFNTPGANANAVKELALAGLLLASRDIVGGIRWVNHLDEPDDQISGLIEAKKSTFSGPELLGKTLGVIGLGSVGVLLANAATDLGMKVLGFDPYISIHSAWGLNSKVKRASSYEQLFAEADYISLHVPLLEDTKHLINQQSIKKMKQGVKILNFARAELIDDSAISEALALGKVAKYVTDFPNGATKKMSNVIQIPHLGASTPESEVNCAIMAANQTQDFMLTGAIKNSVNYPDVDLNECRSSARIIILHRNVVNMVGQITTIIANAGINIDAMANTSKNQWAVTVVDVEQVVSQDILNQINQIDGVTKTRMIVGKL